MATGTKLMKEISDQFLVCKICLEPFKEPKTLSCLHTFCCACLQQQYDAETNRPTRYTLYTRAVTCPLCRKKTDLPTGGVRRLPDNFLVSNLTDVLAKRCMSKVPPCEICHTVRPRSDDACVKCLECDKLLCSACVELHSSTKVTQDHSLIDIEGQKDIECKAHPEETVRFYCEKCEECICVVCTFQEHKDHDVCSFSDGFAKHKVTLESLLGRSKERLTSVESRLKMIEKYETLSKQLKERIRDLAISYTSQVRAREKELICQVDELLSSNEAVSKLSDNKQWLQETFDSLQSACSLTEIVMKDKGVEMLLLKKEIQGKMDQLLGGSLPPEPPELLQQLDVRFVPGEVKLGDVFVPGDVHCKDLASETHNGSLGNAGEFQKSGPNKMTNGVGTPGMNSGILLQNGDIDQQSSTPCKECAERKRKEKEKERTNKGKAKEGEKTTSRSVYIQTAPQENLLVNGNSRNGGHFTTTASQVTMNSSGVSVSHSAMQTPRPHTVSSRHASTDTTTTTSTATNDPIRHHQQQQQQRHQNGLRARGTMTERQDVRTLKVQTEESCLRDTHLGQAAATGSTYPNTGAAIAAAFLRHKDEDAAVAPWSPRSQRKAAAKDAHDDAASAPPWSPRLQRRSVVKDTHDMGVGTDISLGVSTTSSARVVAALCGLKPVCDGGVRGADGGRPDLLAETGGAGGLPSSLPSPSRIRSRKVQTDVSAVAQHADSGSVGAKGEGKSLTDDQLKASLLESASASPRHGAAASSSAHSQETRGSRATRAPQRDAAVMTSFKVRLVPDTAEKAAGAETVTSQTGVMTSSRECRTVYIQTRGPRVTSTGTGTDYQGQMTKSTSTLRVESADAETAMPQVTHDSRGTWTDVVATSERATGSDTGSVGCLGTADAATVTTRVRTGEFGAQVRIAGVAASTNTSAPRLVHHQCQTTPSVCSRATMPDPSIAMSPPPPSPSHRASADLSTTQPPAQPSPSPGARPVSLPASGIPAQPTSTATAVPKADKATETIATRFTTRAVGPNSQMQSSRTTSTDTLNLLQVTDRQTCTPTVKTVDDWTHTPQPQTISTGVTPPHPAVLDVGVATIPVVLMDQATYTEVKTWRDAGSETCVVVCDNETLTDKTAVCDAQTEVEVNVRNQETTMKRVELTEGGCMTDDARQPGLPPVVHDRESQCRGPVLVSKEVNTTRHRRRAKEVQTTYSYTECLLCQHPAKLQQLGLSGMTVTDPGKASLPPDRHDVATMALSCLAASPGLAHSGVQTCSAALYDKNIATSLEFEDVSKSCLTQDCQDAATSTESLPYIGLLSEMDVDELIVIPEASFELVSDSDDDPVPMVDDETLTEVLDYAEVGTQTLLHPLSGGGDGRGEEIPVCLCHGVDCSKPQASIGVNTLPKVTFEKETATPAHHLFSKGTMTFYVAKTDKATSTPSHARPKAAGARSPSGRKESGRQKKMDNKVTMTSRPELRDVAVETDPTIVDGRITQCISKLRNVSQRLNSPTTRRSGSGETLLSQPAGPVKQNDVKLEDNVSDSATQPTNTAELPPKDPQSSRGRDPAAETPRRQMQVLGLPPRADAVPRPKDPSPVRKPQPITTLKPRPATVTTTPTATDGSDYASKSLPRPRSLERQNKVKMGSQATPPSRLPLLRYNSAPDRIATVPAQTLLRKAGASSPRTSPSKIPVSQKPAAGGVAVTDSGSDSESLASSSSQKIQQRPCLPSITETRTPSSCSDSSFVSLESGEPFQNPAISVTSPLASVTNHPVSEATKAISTEAADVSAEGDGDDSSVSSSSAALVAATHASGSSTESLSKPKKEKKGFMRRLLSGKKKKKDSGSSSSDKEQQDADSALKQKQQQQQQELAQFPRPPPSPQTQKKQAKQQAAKGSKTKQKAPPSMSPSQEVHATTSPSVSNPRPPSADSTPTGVQGGGTTVTSVAPDSPTLPPHHYPPLPDPSKSPPVPKKPRPFVYVRQRIFSIQQDNVEEANEKKEKEKEKEEQEKASDCVVG